MTVIPPFEPPVVTDDDVLRVCELLDLGEGAFCGPDGCDPRDAVLRSMEPVDIAACPGSGKTTLLVAKLAILADKWPHRTRGICVLSHTNAARREIETRLGGTRGGESLLAYPHHVGTIHGFVDAYLAVPWLRSMGYPIRMIDTEVCQGWRWSELPPALRSALSRRHHGPSVLSISSTDFDVTVGGIGSHTPTVAACRSACRRSTEAGLFCYDEMFMWADDLISHVPEVVAAIRRRFPLLFIDEAQDNSEEQSSILYRIFMDGPDATLRQRFGDANQAIFDSIQATAATTDAFPQAAAKTDLPNSHRFGQRIADLADPLGFAPYPCGLVGQRPTEQLPSGAAEGQNTIFLFGDGDACKVLPAYGDLLIATFPEPKLRDGAFTAVGQVHRPPATSSKYPKYPHHVGHYWPGYDPQLATASPKPRSYVQYIVSGTERAQTTGEACYCADRLAEGILRLAGMSEGSRAVLRHGRSHRCLTGLLEGKAAMECYQELLAAFAVQREGLTQDRWIGHWRDVVYRIAEAITDVAPAGADVDSFLGWGDGLSVSDPAPTAGARQGNSYDHTSNGRTVSIRVGSIHSVKGETHAATLVLETYYREYNLEKLRDWLEGKKRGGGAKKSEQDYRLRLHYVAMTRPTHLLCLAMRRSSYEDAEGQLERDAIQRLEQRGWHVICL